MNILFLTIGSEVSASSRVRVYQYLPHLKKKGFKYKVVPLIIFNSLSQAQEGPGKKTVFLLNRMYKIYQLFKFFFLCRFYDIIFIQKVVFLPIWFQKIVRLLNNHIIFDFDDAMFIRTRNRINDTSIEAIKYEPKFFHMVSISKFVVILENRYTQEMIGKYNSNICMITGPIDTDRYFPNPKKDSNELVIGWIGSQSTTMYIKPLEKVLYSLSTKYPNIKVELIGASPLSLKGIKMEIKQWSLDTEVEDLQNFDIGVMYLPNNLWTQGKGGYKLLQYMAIGIPCVASPVGINKELIIDGVNGFLCESPKDWEEKLSILIENSELRNLMGKRGREIAVKKYSVTASLPRLVDCLEKVMAK